MVRSTLSVYLHRLCLIFLAGTDIVFQWPSSMRSRGDTSFTTPLRGLSQTRRSAWYIHPFRRIPSPPRVKGLPLDGGRDLRLHMRLLGRQCMLPTSPSTHGHSSTTREQ